MHISYLVTVLIVGAFTLIALFPPRRPRPAAQLSYFLGMTVNEVPHLAAALPLLVATGTALVDGNLSADVPSLILMAGATIVLVGLLVVARRGVAARHTVAAGLREAGIDAPTFPTSWVLRTALTPFAIRPRHVARVADLRYGDDRRQRLDAYHRRDRPTGGPVLLYLHGGGYHSGSKHWEGQALLHRLAARGWVCVSADYRLRPAVGFEEHLADARAALAWARTHASEYGADPSTVVMAGSSAGAHMTSLLALDPDAELSAAICLYGYYGRYYGRPPNEPVVSDPFALPAGHAPPVLVAHGENDTWVPVGAARALVSKLREESPSPVVRVDLPGGQHGFDLLRSWRYSAVLAGIDAFLSHAGVEIPSAREAGATSSVGE